MYFRACAFEIVSRGLKPRHMRNFPLKILGNMDDVIITLVKVIHARSPTHHQISIQYWAKLTSVFYSSTPRASIISK